MEDLAQIERIKGYVLIFHRELESLPNFDELLDYSVRSAIDTVLVYLNVDVLDKRFERITANVVDAIYTKFKKQQAEETEQAISSMSDNGQSVSFFNEVKNYFSTGTDREILQSAVHLLKNHRRVGVLNGNTKTV